jgi:hypothetical protein
MAKFRFYITDLGMGSVHGTDDEKIAENYATSEDFFVVDTNDGTWIMADLKREEIKESPVLDSPAGDDDPIESAEQP